MVKGQKLYRYADVYYSIIMCIQIVVRMRVHLGRCHPRIVTASNKAVKKNLATMRFQGNTILSAMCGGGNTDCTCYTQPKCNNNSCYRTIRYYATVLTLTMPESSYLSLGSTSHTSTPTSGIGRNILQGFHGTKIACAKRAC